MGMNTIHHAFLPLPPTTFIWRVVCPSGLMSGSSYCQNRERIAHTPSQRRSVRLSHCRRLLQGFREWWKPSDRSTHIQRQDR
jgi:hypothetical protein